MSASRSIEPPHGNLEVTDRHEAGLVRLPGSRPFYGMLTRFPLNLNLITPSLTYPRCLQIPRIQALDSAPARGLPSANGDVAHRTLSHKSRAWVVRGIAATRIESVSSTSTPIGKRATHFRRRANHTE